MRKMSKVSAKIKTAGKITLTAAKTKKMNAAAPAGVFEEKPMTAEAAAPAADEKPLPPAKKRQPACGRKKNALLSIAGGSAAALPVAEDDEQSAESFGTAPGRKCDSIKTYMNEIVQFSQITQDQEGELALKIHGTDPAEQSRAREALIQANLRLVVKIAHDFKGWGLQLLDLISEGNIGLMRAADKFDPTKGAKFSSYAAYWIKQFMRRAITNQRQIIRVPVQTASKISKIKTAQIRLSEQYGREPTDSEIAESLDISERTVADLRRANLHTISLQESIQQGEDGEYQDIIPDPGAMTPDRILGNVESVGRLIELLDVLDERERLVLTLRFGLDGHRPKTLEQVCLLIDRTRERVRQIQNQALAKLRDMLQDEADCVNQD